MPLQRKVILYLQIKLLIFERLNSILVNEYIKITVYTDCF